MKAKTLILFLAICSLCFVIDGFRYLKDESGSARFGRENDNGNKSALSQKLDSKKNRSSSRAGKINGSDDEEKDLSESDSSESDSDENNEDGPPGRGPPRRGPPGRGPHRKFPGRGPPNFDDDDDSNDNDKPRNYGRGPSRRGFPRRGPPSFNDDDESDNYGRGGPSRRILHPHNSERNGYKTRFWQRPSDSSGYNNSENDGRDGEGGNEKLRRG